MASVVSLLCAAAVLSSGNQPAAAQTTDSSAAAAPTPSPTIPPGAIAAAAAAATPSPTIPPGAIAEAAAAADYVIIGGGTAGCVLAARLCAGLPDARIVLLERALPRSAEAEATVRAMRNFFNPVIGQTPEVTETWESEPNSGLAGGKAVPIYTGTTIGGTSAITGGQFSTPTNEVAASWGVKGLNAARAGALYTKVRTKLQVDQPPPELTTSYHEEYFAANAAVGVDVIEKPDLPDGADVDSVWTSYLLADETGNRMDAYRGYLEPVRESCSNLEVIEGAVATQIVLDGNQTTGVKYTTSTGASEEQDVRVNGEVILAAGPYHSPKILQLSGIGPAAVLERFNITQAAELPVGQRAQARVYDNILSSYTGVPLSKGGSANAAAAREEALPLFNAGQPSYLGFTTAQINGIWSSPIGIWRVVGWIFDAGEEQDPRVHQSGCIPNPTSFATVTLRSVDPFDPPIVDTNLLGADGEAEQLIACLEKERDVISELPEEFNMTELPRFSDTITPAQVKETAGNGNHFVGTCGIGRVLDADMKVQGFTNLRVVDASAIPEMPPNSGPAASVYMLAEHIADTIVTENGGLIPAQEPPLIVQASTPGAAAVATGCASKLLAVGSFTDITFIDPPPTGEGVTLLTLSLCSNTTSNTTSDTTSTLSASLIEDRLIPTATTGVNPSYCDQYDASLIICANLLDDAGTATILSIEDDTSEKFDLGVPQPVHIAVFSNGVVATAHFSGSSFLTFDPSLGADSVVSTVTVPEGNAKMGAGVAARQEAPHPHQVLEVADGEVVICDLGSDAVYQYSVGADGVLKRDGVTMLGAGSGPRHAAVGPNEKVYVVAELSLQLIELGSDCTEGSEGEARGVCNTTDLPSSGANNSTFTSGAAIRVSKDRKFVYVSLRTEEDSTDLGAIVGYSLAADGSLGELVGTWSTEGQQPRDFNLVEVEGFREVFVVGNRKSSSVVVFDRDEATGARGELLASAAVQSPVSVLAVDRAVDVGVGVAAPVEVATGAPVGVPLGGPGGECGGGGQPVCSGEQLEGRDPPYECDFGFERGNGGVCVPYTPPAGGGSPAPAPGAACGAGGEPVCANAQLLGRDPPYECDFGFVGGDGGVCVPFTPTGPAADPSGPAYDGSDADGAGQRQGAAGRDGGHAFTEKWTEEEPAERDVYSGAALRFWVSEFVEEA